MAISILVAGGPLRNWPWKNTNNWGSIKASGIASYIFDIFKLLSYFTTRPYYMSSCPERNVYGFRSLIFMQITYSKPILSLTSPFVFMFLLSRLRLLPIPFLYLLEFWLLHCQRKRLQSSEGAAFLQCSCEHHWTECWAYQVADNLPVDCDQRENCSLGPEVGPEITTKIWYSWKLHFRTTPDLKGKGNRGLSGLRWFL